MHGRNRGGVRFQIASCIAAARINQKIHGEKLRVAMAATLAYRALGDLWCRGSTGLTKCCLVAIIDRQQPLVESTSSDRISLEAPPPAVMT